MFYRPTTYASSRKTSSYTVKDFSGGVQTVTDENVLPLNYSAGSYNFSFKSGALKDGFGVKESELDGGLDLSDINAQPQAIYCYKRFSEEKNDYVDEILVYANDKNMYSRVLGEESSSASSSAETESDETGNGDGTEETSVKKFKKIENLSFDGAPVSVAYTYQSKNVMIFSYGSVMKIYDGETVTEVSDSPAVTSMCIHNERLFATESGEKTSLWFSDDFDPANWNVSLSEAGFIDLRDGRGSLLKVLELGGYVYVFRNYGITRVTAYGDQTSFSVDGLSASSGRIFGGSITSCGDKIIYLAEDGFYCFTGGAPYRVFHAFDEALSGVDNSTAKGKYFNGRFFISLKMKLGKEVCPCLFVYDFAAKSACVCRGLNVRDFELYEGESCFKLLFLCDGGKQVGELSEKAEFFSVPLKKKWVSGKSDLGKAHAEKTISEVSLYTRGGAVLTVESERGARKIQFEGGETTKKAPLKGKSFRFTIESCEPSCNISKLKIYYEYGD